MASITCRTHCPCHTRRAHHPSFGPFILLPPAQFAKRRHGLAVAAAVHRTACAPAAAALAPQHHDYSQDPHAHAEAPPAGCCAVSVLPPALALGPGASAAVELHSGASVPLVAHVYAELVGDRPLQVRVDGSGAGCVCLSGRGWSDARVRGAGEGREAAGASVGLSGWSGLSGTRDGVRMPGRWRAGGCRWVE